MRDRNRALFGFLTACATFALFQTAFAQDSTAEGQTLPVKISGETAFKFAVPALDGTTSLATIVKTPSLDSTVKMELERGQIRLVSEWDALSAASAIRGATGSASSGIGEGSTYVSLTPLENALYVSTDTAKFGVGWQYFTWGVADQINPTDYLNARDYRYGANAKKLPSFAGSATWYPSDAWSFEGVVEPQYQSSIYGLNWSDQITSDFFGGNEKNVSVRNPSARIDSCTGALRGRFFGSDIDASVSYLYGWDRFYTPEISVSDHGGAYTVDSVVLKHARLHRFGADVKFVVGKFGIWGEASYSVPEASGKSYEYRKSELSWVTGFDCNFGALDQHYVNVQYVGVFVPGYDSSCASDYGNGLPDSGSAGDLAYMRRYYYRTLVQGFGLQTERLLQGVAGTVELSFFEGRFKPTFDYMGFIPLGYDDGKVTRYGSVVLMPKLVLMPLDGFRATAGAEMAWSYIKEKGKSLSIDRRDSIGQMTDDNRVYLEISYSWILP
jgi:hypothetical protein